MNILIAEDESSLRNNLKWLLEWEGYRVTTACNGAEALSCAQNSRPDLVLSDVMMPVLDGYGLIKAMRNDPNLTSVPIIILTAKVELSDMKSAMDIGADCYLTKPCKRNELLDAIQSRLIR